MSSKRSPEIRIVYPDATPAAMLLTEAMIKRSTGKRVVETESEEKEYTGEALFGSVLTCKTDTSVELTLKLNPDAMDYALTTLIAKNLTEEEKRAIRMETDSMEVVDLLSPRAGEAAGAGTCTEEVGSACRAADGQATQSGEQDAIDVPLLPAAEPEKTVEVGKISTLELGDILSDFARGIRSGEEENTCVMRAINSIVDRIKLEAPKEPEEKIEVGRISEKVLKGIIGDAIEKAAMGHGTFDAISHAVHEVKEYIAGGLQGRIEEDAGLIDSLAVLICGAQRVQPKKTAELKLFASDLALYLHEGIDEEACYVVKASELEGILSHVQRDFAEHPGLKLDDELEELGKRRAIEADEDDKKQDGDIDPGLLDDIEDGPAPAGEVIGHDE